MYVNSERVSVPRLQMYLLINILSTPTDTPTLLPHPLPGLTNLKLLATGLHRHKIKREREKRKDEDCMNIYYKDKQCAKCVH